MADAPDKLCYRVRDWDDIYECAQSRKAITWSWVAMPNHHDTSGFRRVAERSNAVEVYCGWVLIVQLASRMPIRGLLATSKRPLTVADIAYRTGFPESCIRAAVEAAMEPKINWLETVDFDSVVGAYQTPGRGLPPTDRPTDRPGQTDPDRPGQTDTDRPPAPVAAQERIVGSDRRKTGRTSQAWQQIFAARILDALGLNSTEATRQAKSMMANARRIATHPDRTRILDELTDLARAKADAGLMRPVAAWQAEFNKQYPKTKEQ